MATTAALAPELSWEYRTIAPNSEPGGSRWIVRLGFREVRAIGGRMSSPNLRQHVHDAQHQWSADHNQQGRQDE